MLARKIFELDLVFELKRIKEITELNMFGYKGAVRQLCQILQYAVLEKWTNNLKSFQILVVNKVRKVGRVRVILHKSPRVRTMRARPNFYISDFIYGYENEF